MKNNNPYSKYRYDNNLSVKVRTTNSDSVEDVFGASIRSVSDNIGTTLYNTQSAPLGATTIVNHIYKVERINQVDSGVVPSSYKGPTFFRLFKL